MDRKSSPCNWETRFANRDIHELPPPLLDRLRLGLDPKQEQAVRKHMTEAGSGADPRY
jgi:hypothetical protein